jgi:hypothetical protein
MRDWRYLLLSVLFLAVMVFSITPSDAQVKVERVEGSHWHYHDNHWNWYDASDKLWYYTDGQNWFYNDGTVWVVYGFDKRFGREGFVREGYRVPERGKVRAPSHKHK